MTKPAAKPARIATVRSTGSRYVVQAVDFAKNVVHCWGEVRSHKGASTAHDGVLKFALADVELAMVPATEQLASELFAQHIAAKRALGHVITGGRRMVDHGTPAQIEDRAARTEKMLSELEAATGISFRR